MKYDIDSIKKRKNLNKNIKKVIYIFLVIIIYNFILLSISYFSNIEFSGLFGYKAFAITTQSMLPTINVGDAIIVQKCEEDKIKEGDIVTFKQNGEFITHRITQIKYDAGKKQYITKGDNNNVPDSKTVAYEEIQGVHVITIPFLGNLISIAANSIFVILILIIIALLYLYKLDKDEKSENRREKKKIEDERFQSKQ